eukprot:CAMPEP_0116132304 /NCGR_PEP_ID=MMETSP0329-20121206/9474_1 /TAXON_ID=697910 /ORGANISM="Pseudo-nitzschia arenysensis, Strain B593" /LENGTH=266 /DNA_ID=CAMNT_0003626805 /DNA_START=177 /DNA_END=977 /DNA_ORIENTATION=+
MKSIQNANMTAQTSLVCCLFFVLIVAILIPQDSHGFQSPLSSSTHFTAKSRQQSRLDATIIDPVDAIANAQQVGDIPVESLAAILTSTIIAPSADALAHFHGAATTAAPMVKPAAATIQEMLPSAGDAMQAQAQMALDSGYKVLDATKFVHGGAEKLPGFSETQSIVAPHLLPGPSDEAVTMKEWPQTIFKARMEYASTMLRAIQKLPYVAFAYALLEFFFLRSDVDIYKEDVEDDPSGVLAETVSDTSVRLAIFFGLAIVTYVIS